MIQFFSKLFGYVSTYIGYYDGCKDYIYQAYMRFLEYVLEGKITYLAVYNNKKYTLIYTPYQACVDYCMGCCLTTHFLDMLDMNKMTYISHAYKQGFKKVLSIPDMNKNLIKYKRPIGLAIYNDSVNVEAHCKMFQEVLSQNHTLTTYDFLKIIQQYSNLPINLDGDRHEILILWTDTFEEQIFKSKDIFTL